MSAWNLRRLVVVSFVFLAITLSLRDGRAATETIWDETSVRKVLQTFAYGGNPTEDQISAWAAMPAEEAIGEMLNFDVSNPKLSQPDLDTLPMLSGGTLEGLADHFSSDSPDNYVDAVIRPRFHKLAWTGPAYNWLMAAMARGMNSFVHRIGFFETNYHMSVNQGAGVYPYPVIRHYDNIIARLSESSSYQYVLAQGALNAAIAYQYGHNNNIYFFGRFWGNDDFAREFHQLFFGILGEYAPAYHEDVTIENTALALTGIRANYHTLLEGGPDVEVHFSTDLHHVDPLEILQTTIEGPSAKEKITALAEVAIDHQESLDNLPLIIVGSLADDNLTAEKEESIRAMWRSLPEPNLLEFLKVYAVSDIFHSPERIKFHSSFDKQIFSHKQMLLSNLELYEGFNPVTRMLAEDDVSPFYPIHNVFGHQTGLEALNSPAIFKNNYNTSTLGIAHYERVDRFNVSYQKEWGNIIPRSEDGSFIARDVAQWLWNRFVVDGGKNYGVLEEAHLCALLNTGRDIGAIMHDYLRRSPDPDTVYYSSDFEQTQSAVGRVFERLAESQLDLDNPDAEIRNSANRYVQRAIAFIASTPYTFLQEGR